MMTNDVSIIIPAYNEENNIEAAINSVISAVTGVVDDYEIIVVNDGSQDTTGQKAQDLAKINNKIRVLHNDINRGHGYTVRRGLQNASKNYISAFPGDNDIANESMRQLMFEVGRSDLVIAYMTNADVRPWLRRVISRSFVGLMNGLFGLKLKYYNGLFIFKRSLIQSFSIKSNSFDVVAECLVRMIKSGCEYKEVGFKHVNRATGKSKAVNIKSVYSALKTIIVLLYDIKFSSMFRKSRPCTN